LSLAADCLAAREKLDAIIARVCGACEKSCCFNGTMMGSQDLIRLRRALLEDEAFAARVRSRLTDRGRELARTWASLTGLRQELEARADVPADKGSALAANLAHWQTFAATLEEGVSTGEPELLALLRYAAIRAMTLQALAAIPEARPLLDDLGKDDPFLRFSGDRLPRDRCLFHLEGCIAEDARPRKCAAFYCKSDPNLISIVKQEMTFGEFVLAHVQPTTSAELAAGVQFEVSLGRRYVEPKAIIAEDRRFEDDFVEMLRRLARSVAIRPRDEGGAYIARHDISEWLRFHPTMSAAVMSRQAVNGAELYELSIGLDLVESPLGRPWAYLVARELQPDARPHPFWLDDEISQPIAALQILLVT
jgi:hypothetical protein